jgi:hypothetical protein
LHNYQHCCTIILHIIQFIFHIAFSVLFLLHIYFSHNIYLLIFNSNMKPCKWQPLGGVGTQGNTSLFCMLLEEGEEYFLPFPRDFNINLRVMLVGKKNTISTSLCACNPNKLVHIGAISWAEQRRNQPHTPATEEHRLVLDNRGRRRVQARRANNLLWPE